MKTKLSSIVLSGALLASIGCSSSNERSFGGDVAFLRSHTQTIVLGNKSDGPRVAVVPAWQGRVMTSAAKGDQGTSYGWINDKHVASGKFSPQINLFGGEERFWIGPEGGQFSFYFDKGKDITDFTQWRVPSFVDTVPWNVSSKTDSSVTFNHKVSVKNWSDNKFDVHVKRVVSLVDKESIKAILGNPLKGISAVGYESDNTITNVGKTEWTEKTGMPSVWILGMYKSGDQTTAVVPYASDSKAEKSGKIVNDDYFGKGSVSKDRLVVEEKDSVMYFACDSKMRAKIGLTPFRSKGLAGSWDATRGVLTIVHYNVPVEETRYVNSVWKMQDKPFAGDALNAYNDGPNDSGESFGPFYELETSSPALALKPNASYTHTQRTIHLEGDRQLLNDISVKMLGVALKQIEKAINIK